MTTTIILQRIEEPTAVDRLLDDFVESRGVMGKDATPIRGFDGLPSVVSRLIMRATNTGDSWACWADERNHISLAVAKMLPPSSRDAPQLLKVELYDTDGVLEESGSWFKDDEGDWLRWGD